MTWELGGCLRLSAVLGLLANGNACLHGGCRLVGVMPPAANWDSYSTRRPVIEEIRLRVPLTLQLAVPAAVVALAVAVPAGILSAMRRNRLADQVVRVVSLAGASMPSFWLALLLILFFAVKLALVPAAGRHGFTSVLLPVFALSLGPAAVLPASPARRGSGSPVARSGL